MKTNPFKSSLNIFGKAFVAALAMAGNALAATSFTITNSSADAMLSATSPSLNFGSAGTLAISSSSAPKGEFASLVKFNTAAAITQFNTTYGAGNWQITGLTLLFASNLGTNGATPANNLLNSVHNGSFGIDWLTADSWTEGAGNGNGANNGAVSFSSISGLLGAGFDSLGNYTFTPPGNNAYANYALMLDSGFVNDAAAGGDVSLYLFAADTQVSYLINSKEFASNRPELTLTVAIVPEPTSLALLGIGGLWLARKIKR